MSPEPAFHQGDHLDTPRTLSLVTLLIAAVGVAPRVHAAGAPQARAAEGQDAARGERARLQADLARVNAEIDALKRRPRGIRDDYRLRSRMADAEALARRLTELDARLGPSASGPAPVAAPPEIRVSPGDDRAEREAKADILADQAQRLSVEANRLEARLTTLRARNALKRHASQLDRDPFAPLEQAKSRIAVTAGASPAPDSAKGVQPPTMTPTDTPGRGATGTGTNISGGSAAPGSGASLPPGTVDQPHATPGTPLSPATPLGTDAAGSLASQLRGVLDPASLEEVRRLETPGSGPGDLAAMQRALSLLRGRAARLSAASAALRASATRPAP